MKIRLTESKFRYMIAEMVKEVLLEAQMSLDDVYNKHYNGIDKDLFLAAVNADPTSKRTDDGKIIGKGNYIGWIMQLAKNGKWRPENSEETTELLTQFASYSKKNQLPQGTDIGKIKSLEELRAFLESITPRQTRSEIKQGAEKVYEDEEWVIIVPHTEEASCIYGKGTTWCTAATSSQNRFDSYNKKGTLYIIINRKDPDEKYQIFFAKNESQFVECRDCYNNSIPPMGIGFSEGVLNFYRSKKLSLYSYSIIEYFGGDRYLAYDEIERGYCIINNQYEPLSDYYKELVDVGYNIACGRRYGEDYTYINCNGIPLCNDEFVIYDKFDIYRNITTEPLALVGKDLGVMNLLKTDGTYFFSNDYASIEPTIGIRGVIVVYVDYEQAILLDVHREQPTHNKIYKAINLHNRELGTFEVIDENDKEYIIYADGRLFQDTNDGEGGVVHLKIRSL